MLPRFGAYAVLALGFWLLFQGFERGNVLSGIVGGVLIIAGMYLMTGVWRNMFARFGGGNYKKRKENDSSDDIREDNSGGTGDSIDGSDEGGQLPP